MPVIRINAIDDRPELHERGGPPNLELMRCNRGNRWRSGPMIVMIHGYKYHPGHPRHCPHRQILTVAPGGEAGRSQGWPRHLGFGTGRPGEGLAICFGWQARGALRHARDRAVSAGRALARVLAIQKRLAPKRPVHLIAHSMGVEVALEALHHLPAAAVGRIIAMTGACYLGRAQAALCTRAGRSAELINVTSRENDAFDFLFERLIAPPCPGDRAIGHGLSASNALTLQLDCPGTLAHLRGLGLPVAAPQRRICHWSAYTRPGVLQLYDALLRKPETLPLDLLRRGLPATGTPRWSRLLAIPGLSRPRAFARYAP